MPKSPEERLSALEESVKSIETQATQINDLQSSVEELRTQFQSQTDGLNEQNQKMDQILSAVQAANNTPPPASEEPEAPSAPASSQEDPAPATGLTVEEIAQAVKDATSGDIEALRSEISDLKAGNFEASRTLTPESEGEGEESSAKVGDEGGESSSDGKLTSYADFFAADKEVNPAGWSFDAVPKGEEGLRALRNMELRYGPEKGFSAESFNFKIKQGTNEFPIIRARRQTVQLSS